MQLIDSLAAIVPCRLNFLIFINQIQLLFHYCAIVRSVDCSQPFIICSYKTA